ncbi:membrane protein [Terrihabitans soli]|uniref:Membrane protein n=1 Tax=Terrihabitans soli TaxID=708113 RepID=A0A6S6QL07_9HYPH|nr:MTH938/NDUFAF3 family protein [Terrihabitans soli]BCJ91064.1 membrane protein [Terrihabitans soli]
MAAPREDAHFPGRTPLDAYGNGGFRFADMSHRGSILCLPSGVWSWAPNEASEITLKSFEKAIEEAAEIEIFLIGTGDLHVHLDPRLRQALKDAGLRVDVMATGPAARTYNVLIGDQRKVAAALIAVENAR